MSPFKYKVYIKQSKVKLLYEMDITPKEISKILNITHNSVLRLIQYCKNDSLKIKHSIKCQENYIKNKDKRLKQSKKYYEENKEIIIPKMKKYNQNRPEKRKEIGLKYKMSLKGRISKQKQIVRRRIFRQKMRQIDNSYFIPDKLRERVRVALKSQGVKKNNKTIELVGCSIEYLRKYLEVQFDDKMTWQNYGKWHIDHIIPCASFDLSDIEQQKKCFHYTNLQPLWAIDNIRKGAKLDYQF